ncbi:MAG TPA: nucleotidyl transferase AbiEii/AbiGii toxin family protein [Longimicrobium sp.]|nr:nucleotidyl transferase AbiEii/AbiGii toxin family protein [Longimicrobium sp.]
MRPRPEIIAWREHAAWRTDAQVEQDLLLTRAVVAIFRDDFLASQVAMRGGTVLHKVHLAPASRYSEDIDLVLVGARPISHVLRALARVLTPELGPPVRSIFTTLQLAVRNAVQPSKIARMVFAYRPTFAPPAEMTIKVEVNYSERDPVFAVIDLPYHPPLAGLSGPVMLRSYDLNEMLGTKLRALLQRTQGRDLFDLQCALARYEASVRNGGTPLFEPERVAVAFLDYMRRENTVITRALFERELERKLANRSFRDDMPLVLPAGLEFDVLAAGEAVRSVLLSHLP